MDTTKVQRLAGQVRRFRERFLLNVADSLGSLLSAGQIEQAVARHVVGYRERTYSPLVALGMFVEQVLSADHSCQDAVARNVSARVRQGQVPGSLNSGPYCKARQRLPWGLLAELCWRLGEQLCRAQPVA